LLILRGANSGNNEIAGSIPNNGVDRVLSLEKSEASKWILSGRNTFSGATVVNAGTLSLAGSSCLSDTASLDIKSGAKLDLGVGVKEKVGSLLLNGVGQALGVWGSATSGAENTNNTYFSGQGRLYVGVDPPSSGSVFTFQ
jgi:autotransporter-associated beta strand protein